MVLKNYSNISIEEFKKLKRSLELYIKVRDKLIYVFLGIPNKKYGRLNSLRLEELKDYFLVTKGELEGNVKDSLISKEEFDFFFDNPDLKPRMEISLVYLKGNIYYLKKSGDLQSPIIELSLNEVKTIEELRDDIFKSMKAII